MHDNHVYFDRAGIETFKFTLKAHEITSGKSFGKVESGVNDAGMPYIMVEADRKKSEPVAAWFREKAKGGETLGNSSDPYPKELNFAIQGDLEVKVVGGKTILCDDIVIGQGSYGTSNNWWVSGPHMQHGSRFSKFGLTISGIGQICGFPREPGGALLALVSVHNNNTFSMIIESVEVASTEA